MNEPVVGGRGSMSGCSLAERGYVMLAALVVVALAFLILGTSLALVSSATRVRAADETSARALALAEHGLADARERIRWGWAGRAAIGVVERPAAMTVAEGTYTISVERVPEPLSPAPSQAATAASTPGPLSSPSALSPDPPGERWYRVEVDAQVGRGRHGVRASVAASPTALPRGLAVAGDLEAGDLVVVSGCGVYVGGEVRGREHIAPDPASGRDEACPEWFAVPGVHAGEGIFADGAEEHAGGAPPAVDTDPHAGGAPPASTWRLPAPSVLGDLVAHATNAGAALLGDTLLLDALPAAPDAADAAGSADGVIVVVRDPASQGGVHIEGSRASPSATSALTLVIEGDATVAAPAALCGELVVTGTLRVVAPLTVYGSLAAGALAVASPLRVELAADWTQRPPPGALTTRVTCWDDAPLP